MAGYESNINNSICSEKENVVTQNIQQLEVLHYSIDEYIGEFQEQLDELLFEDSFSDYLELLKIVNEIFSLLYSVIPKVDLKELEETYMDSTILQKEFKSPINVLRDTVETWAEMGRDWVHEFADEEFPEFVIIKNISEEIPKWKKEVQITHDLITEIDDALTFMSEICAFDSNGNVIDEVVEKIDQYSETVNGFLDSLLLDESGNFSLDKLLDSVDGLTDEQKLEMKIVDETERIVIKTFEIAADTAVSLAEEQYFKFRRIPIGDSLLVSGYGSSNLGQEVTDLSEHYNSPTIIISSPFYNQIDPDSVWVYDWSAITLPMGSTTRTGMLDVSVELKLFTIEEKYSSETRCFSVYTAEVEVIIGEVKKTYKEVLPKPFYVCKDCGYYPISGFDECNDKDWLAIRKYTAETIQKAIEKAIEQFTFEEVENQLFEIFNDEDFDEISYAILLYNEFIENEDLDNNGKIYGKDFTIPRTDKEIPFILALLYEDPDFTIDDTVYSNIMSFRSYLASMKPYETAKILAEEFYDSTSDLDGNYLIFGVDFAIDPNDPACPRSLTQLMLDSSVWTYDMTADPVFSWEYFLRTLSPEVQGRLLVNEFYYVIDCTSGMYDSTNGDKDGNYLLYMHDFMIDSTHDPYVPGIVSNLVNHPSWNFDSIINPTLSWLEYIISLSGTE